MTRSRALVQTTLMILTMPVRLPAWLLLLFFFYWAMGLFVR